MSLPSTGTMQSTSLSLHSLLHGIENLITCYEVERLEQGHTISLTNLAFQDHQLRQKHQEYSFLVSNRSKLYPASLC